MLVYGDHERRADPRHLITSINRRLDGVESSPAGLQRHSALVAALIDAGQLQQGLEDAAFEATQCDGTDRRLDGIVEFVHRLASAVRDSWQNDHAVCPRLPHL